MKISEETSLSPVGGRVRREGTVNMLIDLVRKNRSYRGYDHLKPLLIVAVGKPDEEIILTDAVDGKTGYYRDECDRHYVPKRAATDMIIRKE